MGRWRCAASRVQSRAVAGSGFWRFSGVVIELMGQVQDITVVADGECSRVI